QTSPLHADALIIASAHDAARQARLDVSLKKIRGQVTLVHATAASAVIDQALCHSGYWTPAIDGFHCVGASFNLHDLSPQARAEDDQANLSELRRNAGHLWQAMGGDDMQLAGSRVGFRCQSPDFLPLAGALSSRVYCNVAHGSRGISGTPLCADLIAASICGETQIADRRLRDALAPGRFRRRKERQGKSRTGNKPEPKTP
ncbi:MAG: FAD-dependent oxidoreductase, partial [Alcanivoracaceae bacterium]